MEMVFLTINFTYNDFLQKGFFFLILVTYYELILFRSNEVYIHTTKRKLVQIYSN